MPAATHTRPWRIVATEVTLEADPYKLLRLVEELTRALAEQGVCEGTALDTHNPKLPKSA